MNRPTTTFRRRTRCDNSKTQQCDKGGDRCMDLYIYYRVRTEDATRFQARAAAMQQALARDHGIGGALKRRPEAKDGMHTWMEIYAAAPENIESTLANAVST